MGEDEANGEPAHGFTAVAEFQQRRVLHQSSPFERIRPPTDGIVLCSRVSRGRPQLRVEIKPTRVAGRRGRSARPRCGGPGFGLRCYAGRGTTRSSSCFVLGEITGANEEQEAERQGTNQEHGEIKHVGLERVQLRPRVSQASDKSEEEERGERKFRQQYQNDQSGKVGSGRFVSRVGPIKTHRKEMSRSAGLVCHQGGAEMGEDLSAQKPVPVFVRYFRQLFNHSWASAPMKRECLSVLKFLDIAVQRLKAVEQISQGVAPGTANRLEIIPAEMFSLASEEKRAAAQEQMREMKTSWSLNSWNPSSWNPKVKGWEATSGRFGSKGGQKRQRGQSKGSEGQTRGENGDRPRERQPLRAK